MKTLMLNVECRLCDKDFTFAVNEQGYKNWLGGLVIQQAMPELTPGQRELLISGTCDDCWELLFGE